MLAAMSYIGSIVNIFFLAYDEFAIHICKKLGLSVKTLGVCFEKLNASAPHSSQQ
jgi:hypothetical protein